MKAAASTIDLPISADCWKTIGVQGNSSCVQLNEHVHCRNCPVYSAAAVQLLEGDPPTDYLAQWTRQVSQREQLAEADSHSIVVFRIGAEWLALPVAVFQEIADMRTVHSLPHRRGGIVLGLANVRGELLACVSLRRVLGIEAGGTDSKREKQRSANERLLVMRRETHRVVCPVDEVYGIERFHPQELQEGPATVARAGATYTRGVLAWQKKSVGVLDDQLLFHTFNRSLSSATMT
jgi:chemotaxis-related protein WspD